MDLSPVCKEQDEFILGSVYPIKYELERELIEN